MLACSAVLSAFKPSIVASRTFDLSNSALCWRLHESAAATAVTSFVFKSWICDSSAEINVCCTMGCWMLAFCGVEWLATIFSLPFEVDPILVDGCSVADV